MDHGQELINQLVKDGRLDFQPGLVIIMYHEADCHMDEFVVCDCNPVLKVDGKRYTYREYVSGKEDE